MNSQINTIKQRDCFILNLFCFWLLIDSINGFFLRLGEGVPISIIYKLFIILLLSFRLLKFKQGRCVLCCIVIYILWQSLHYIYVSPEIYRVPTAFVEAFNQYLYICLHIYSHPTI